jgi:hypothetical protein
MGERKAKPIDAETVRRFFDYEDGVLTWKVKKGRANIGDTAWVSSHGYKMLTFNREQYQEHRLIWAWHYGDVPDYLDHIDGDFTNNRVENLRPATHQQNMCNRKMPSHNKTGVKGVYMERGKFRGYIAVGRDKRFFGPFHSLDEAAKSVAAARAEMHKEFANHG